MLLLVLVLVLVLVLLLLVVVVVAVAAKVGLVCKYCWPRPTQSCCSWRLIRCIMC